ncbi:MAG: hypothetical protein EA379_00970, partial [Phycisphaerales bacterium]
MRLRLTAATAAACFLAPFASGQWSDDPSINLAVAQKPGSQVIPKVAGATDGGLWISWFDNASSNFDVYIQRLDYLGHKQFPSDGLVVSAFPQASSLNDYDMIADDENHAVVVHNDIRDGADRDIYAQRISPSGMLVWGPGGVRLSDNTNFEPDPRVAQLASGDFAFVWPRTGSPNSGLVYQRVNKAGVKAFPGDGVPIAGFGAESPAFHDIIATSDGGFICVYIRDTATFLSPRHVYIQKFDADGLSEWNGGSPVIVSANVVPIAHRPRILSDGADGAIVAWHDTRTGAFNAWVQRYTANGTALFPNEGARAANDPMHLHLDPAIGYIPGADEVLVVWNKRDASQGMRGLSVQRLDATGARLMGDTGATLVPMGGDNVSSPRMSRAPGGFYAVYSNQPAGAGGGNRINAHRLDTLGAPVWAQPTIMATEGASRFRLEPSTAANGVLRLAWEDARNDNADIYAQNLNPDGSIGACNGDANYDGVIDFADLSAVLSEFGMTGEFLIGDVNGDGVVDF